MEVPEKKSRGRPRKIKEPEIPKEKYIPAGRPQGSTQWKKLNWDITFYDKNTNELKSGKFCSVNQMNKTLGTNFSSQLVHRLSRERVEKYGHIKITKINEPIVPRDTPRTQRPQEE